MEEIVAVDALLADRRVPMFLLPEEGLQSYIVVPRAAFDEDLLRAFPHRNVGRAVRAQVLLDAPRCRVEVEGKRVYTSVPSVLYNDLPILALCTQAVVGLPVELLHRSVGLVMEPSRETQLDTRLNIKVWKSGEFVAHKRLLVYDREDPVPIILLVQGGGEDVFMCIIPDRL